MNTRNINTATVIANILELVSSVIINISGNDISNNISGNKLTKDVVETLIIQRIKMNIAKQSNKGAV